MKLLVSNIELEIIIYKRQRIPKVQSKMDNTEKLATLGTQDEDKNTTQYVLDTTFRKETHIR